MDSTVPVLYLFFLLAFFLAWLTVSVGRKLFRIGGRHWVVKVFYGTLFLLLLCIMPCVYLFLLLVIAFPDENAAPTFYGQMPALLFSLIVGCFLTYIIVRIGRKFFWIVKQGWHIKAFYGGLFLYLAGFLLSAAWIAVAIGEEMWGKYKQEWKNEPAALVVDGIENPYKIKDFLYYKSTFQTDMDGRRIPGDHTSGSKPFCRAEVYLVSRSMKKMTSDDVLDYLRQFDKPELQQAYRQDKRTFVYDRSSSETTWMPLPDLLPVMFNPFDKELQALQDADGTPEPDRLGNYPGYLVCQDILYGRKPFRRIEERFKPVFKTIRYKNIHKTVMNDPDTLVRLYSDCRIVKVDFYNAKRRIYIETQTDYRLFSVFSDRHSYRFPACR